MPNKRSKPEIIQNVTPLPERDLAAHKGQVGRVVIIAGSRDMSGAARLAAAGALRGGAGLVRVLTPASIQMLTAAGDPCLMTAPLAETAAGLIDWNNSRDVIDEAFAWATTLALGPGLGHCDDLGDLARYAIEKFDGPLVIDADGLNNIAADGPAVWKKRGNRPAVITPHPGEMTRLCRSAKIEFSAGDEDDARRQAAHEYAVSTGVTTVLKGHATVVASPDAIYVNSTGNPGMATGGMGDVLTGLIAALAGQSMSAFDAACLGVYCHGLAADLCSKQIGPVGILARDVAESLPAALAQSRTARMGFTQ